MLNPEPQTQTDKIWVPGLKGSRGFVVYLESELPGLHSFFLVNQFYGYDPTIEILVNQKRNYNGDSSTACASSFPSPYTV